MGVGGRGGGCPTQPLEVHLGGPTSAHRQEEKQRPPLHLSGGGGDGDGGVVDTTAPPRASGSFLLWQEQEALSIESVDMRGAHAEGPEHQIIPQA